MIMNILECYNPDSSAVINPGFGSGPIPGFPEVAVCCFMQSTVSRLLPELCQMKQEPLLRLPGSGAPVWIAEYTSEKAGTAPAGAPSAGSAVTEAAGSAPHDITPAAALAVCRFPVGAPAAAAALENLYAAGARAAVVFGTCGVLRSGIEDCSVIIPQSAVRCEGTSFHYAPASDEITLNSRYKEEFVKILENLSLPYCEGKVWTTDAIYRETRSAVQKRRKQGCICVDMECSALAAVSQFRGRDFFQFFCAADNLDAPEWEPRSLHEYTKHDRKLLAVRAALELASLMRHQPDAHKSISP